MLQSASSSQGMKPSFAKLIVNAAGRRKREFGFSELPVGGSGATLMFCARCSNGCGPKEQISSRIAGLGGKASAGIPKTKRKEQP
jgi:hypothetical protein